VDGFKIYSRKSAYMLKNSTKTKLHISQDNGCYLKTGIQNNAYTMAKFDKIVDLVAQLNIWSKQSIFSTNLCLDQSNNKIF